ncbi:MAG: hypothetical protein AAGA75_24935 [Cyanobacteria bacterium P01_E01_bin.6]
MPKVLTHQDSTHVRIRKTVKERISELFPDDHLWKGVEILLSHYEKNSARKSDA